MVAQAQRLSWQVLLVIALAVALVATISITYWATHSYGMPHHVLADGGPQPNGGDSGWGH
jgi:hypothetical protein